MTKKTRDAERTASDEPESAPRAPSLPRFRVKFPDKHRAGLPELVVEAADEKEAARAYRERLKLTPTSIEPVVTPAAPEGD